MTSMQSRRRGQGAAGGGGNRRRPSESVSSLRADVAAAKTRPMPVAEQQNWPSSSLLPATQLLAHVASTTIMVLLILCSFAEDLSRLVFGSRRTVAVTVTSSRDAKGSSPAKTNKKNKKKTSRRSSGNVLRVTNPSTVSSDHDKDDDDEDADISSTTLLNDTASTTSADSSIDSPAASPTQSKIQQQQPLRAHTTYRHVPPLDPPFDEKTFFATRRTTGDVRDYCAHAGYACDTYEACTADDFVITVHRVGRHKPGSYSNTFGTRGPVLLMHGLFQSSGVWVSSGMESLAFHLVDAGFDVWLGNNRAVILQHVRHTSSDPEFWNWSLDELAMYDIPTMVDLVLTHSKSPRLSFIGHSQGNAQAFHALTHIPSLNSKLSLFVALAPAVHTGPLLSSFPVSLLMNCPPQTHRMIFGTKAFLPIMSFVQRNLPPWLFATLAYHMFHYLFNWSDRNWDTRNKPAYFMFTPRPTSSKALAHWAQIGRSGNIHAYDRPEAYDVRVIRCPLALYISGDDTIVDGKRLLDECMEGGVNVVVDEILEGYEHMDALWGVDAKERVWRGLVKVLGRFENKTVLLGQ